MAAKNGKSAQDRNRLQAFQAKQELVKEKSLRRRRDNQIAGIAALAAVAIAVVSQLSYFTAGPGAQPSSSATPSPSVSASVNSAKVPSTSLAQDRTWTGSMMLNNVSLGLSLDGKKAPQAVANFISLSKKNFFANTKCHRLVTSQIFVLQCGDPKADGTGGPGYSWGPIENAPTDALYKTGYLAMARQSQNGSSMGSQFFIVYKDSNIPADSAGGYTVFGKITSGLSEAMKPILAAGVVPAVKDGVSTAQVDGKPVAAAVIGKIVLN
jgi:peptidyl-prolyl cis-trans isomerase B (cyclophilin B)